MEIQRGRLFLAKGPMRLVILSGRVACRGIEFTPESRPLIVKAWETFDIQALEDSQIRREGMGSLHRTARSYPKEWLSFVGTLPLEEATSIMIAGESDTGKSTLCTMIANAYLSHGRDVCIVDSDVGQSDIGPPTTVGLGLAKNPIIRLTEASLADAYFAGDTSPAHCLEEVVYGTARMMGSGRELGEVILFDTSGLVTGPLGQHLTLGILEAVKPDPILLLERDSELEYIKTSYARCTRLPALPSSQKNTQARRAFRLSQFLDFLKGSGVHNYDLSDLRVEGYLARRKTELHQGQAESALESSDLTLRNLIGMENVVVGLHLGEKYIDLGLIDSVNLDQNLIRILTPTQEHIDRIILGNLRMGPGGESRLRRFEGTSAGQFPS